MIVKSRLVVFTAQKNPNKERWTVQSSHLDFLSVDKTDLIYRFQIKPRRYYYYYYYRSSLPTHKRKIRLGGHNIVNGFMEILNIYVAPPYLARFSGVDPTFWNKCELISQNNKILATVFIQFTDNIAVQWAVHSSIQCKCSSSRLEPAELMLSWPWEYL